MEKRYLSLHDSSGQQHIPGEQSERSSPGWTGPAPVVAGIAPARRRNARRFAFRLGRGLGIPILMALMLCFSPAPVSAQVAVGVFVSYGPPLIPVYVQPLCPGPGYIWTPGFWAWDPAFGYYWVPGTWVLAPFPGALWTPGYWGWVDADDGFEWFDGYWGPVVGFYGGIDYGFGYTGYGYQGGYWNRGVFFYNTTVNRINTINITTVYNRTITRDFTESRVSFNGGRGGITARPSTEQMTAVRERRSGPIGEQMRQEAAARADPHERASVNHGWPEVAATPRAGVFRGQDVVRAERRGPAFNVPAESTGPRPFTRGGENRVQNESRPSLATPSRAPASREHSVEPQRPSRMPDQTVPRSNETRAPEMRQPQSERMPSNRPMAPPVMREPQQQRMPSNRPMEQPVMREPQPGRMPTARAPEPRQGPPHQPGPPHDPKHDKPGPPHGYVGE